MAKKHIQNLRLFKSVSLDKEEHFFDKNKEIIFVGRSNVGKSSLLNTIFERKSFVKTSSTPGSTRTVNIFVVNNKYFFTDMPGYAFAKLDKLARAKLDHMIDWYILEKLDHIKRVVILVDSVVGATQGDIDMFAFLQGHNVPVVIILNKVDKVNQNHLQEVLKNLEFTFFGQKIIKFSSRDYTGKEELLDFLFNDLK